MQSYIEDALEKKIWAVVGVSPKKEKYGYKVYKSLKDKGYQVYPVNPLYTDVEGDKCYQSLRFLPVVPQVVNMVVAPKFGKQYVDEAGELGVEYIWFQPGAESPELVNAAESKGLKAIYGACVLLQSR
ncbi:CoA-binding protein [Caldanaerobius polysaccharolyticus]|uniref:CoA-binding protein n=1 Tax=Caldanaerobius polysaccharolyticus TaxID=44256 RepID=UPI003898E847